MYYYFVLTVSVLSHQRRHLLEISVTEGGAVNLNHWRAGSGLFVPDGLAVRQVDDGHGCGS